MIANHFDSTWMYIIVWSLGVFKYIVILTVLVPVLIAIIDIETDKFLIHFFGKKRKLSHYLPHLT